MLKVQPCMLWNCLPFIRSLGSDLSSRVLDGPTSALTPNQDKFTQSLRPLYMTPAKLFCRFCAGITTTRLPLEEVLRNTTNTGPCTVFPEMYAQFNLTMISRLLCTIHVNQFCPSRAKLQQIHTASGHKILGNLHVQLHHA